MKSYFTAFCFLMLFVAATFTFSIAQTSWTKYEGNPVLDPGPTGAWDAGIVVYSNVIYDGDVYHMWYAGGRNQGLQSIGYASSADGLNWTKYDDPSTTSALYVESDPVLVAGQAGQWDDAVVSAPHILHIDSIFHMWYVGTTSPELLAGSIGYATSLDGISWQKDTINNPVLTPGVNGTWDDTWIWRPFVMYIGSTLHMWYDAWNGNNNQVRIGHATAAHLDSSWTKDPANPVIRFGTSQSWDYPRVDVGSVVYDGNTYHMWYSGGDIFTWRIGYATSQDGSAWTKYNGNPVMDWGMSGSWDDRFVTGPKVTFDLDSQIFKMWYNGGNGDWDSHIGYATAPLNLNVPDNFATIQQAIDAAHDGNVVLVAEGTYYENINFKGKAITVASHFYLDGDTSHISNTIIDGSQSSDPDSGSVVYFVSGEDTNSVLSGFTITGGSGTKLRVFPHWWISKAGGGIHILLSGAKIENNKIINNNISVRGDTVAGGTAIAAYGEVGDYLIIRDNLISENTATSAFHASGTVYWGMKETTVFERNIVSGNICSAANVYGGGLLLAGQEGWRGLYIVRNNIIKGNILDGVSAGSGGGIHIGNCSPEITNNIISGNEAPTGGGIAVNQWDNTIEIQKPLLINNSILNNSAVTSGGGIYIDGSQQPAVKAVNNIIWGNAAPNNPQIGIASGSITVHYSDVQGGWTGEGNMDAEPLFADIENGDFHLLEGSPGIGWGTDSSIVPKSDFYGNKRPDDIDDFVDMGAIESTYAKTGTWRLQTIINGAPPLQGVRAVSQDIVWACSGDAFAYRTTDGGQNWQQSALITSDEAIFVIEALDSMTAFAGGGNIFSNFGNAVLYRTTDGGQSWDSVYTAMGSYTFWNMIHFFDAQNGIAMSDAPEGGQPFVIVKTTDGGTTWTPISMPPTPNPNEYGMANAFQFYNEMNGWFGTNNSDRIFRTTDGGETWTGYPTGNTNGSIWSVNFVSLTTGVRTSNSSPYLARTTDGGQTWTPVNGLPVSDIRIIRAGAVASMSGSSQIWISGEATSNSTPFMLTSTDSGQTWIEQVLPSLSGEFIQDMSAAVFGNSIQVWAVTLDHSDFSSGGQILTLVVDGVTALDEWSINRISDFRLEQNYPNPFNPVTNIEYRISNLEYVELSIYNILGQKVATLVNQKQIAGTYNVQWNASGFASGIYFYRLETEGYVSTRKLLLLK